MEEVLYENVRLEKDRAYFLYVGEIKGHGLNHFLKEPLERVHGRPVDFISIIPDVLSEYRHGNLVVINPEAGRLRRETGLTTIIVTHNIEEAVFLGKRILALSMPPNRAPRIVENPEAGGEGWRSDTAFLARCDELRAALGVAA